MKMLSPSNWVDTWLASNAPILRGSLPTACKMSSKQLSLGLAQAPFFTNAAVGVAKPLMATRVRPGRMRTMVSLPAVTIGSQPNIKSAAAVDTRVVRISSCCCAINTWLQVAPPFCARPAESCVTMPLPSMCAAMPSNWPMVMTPVPPTPATTMP